MLYFFLSLSFPASFHVLNKSSRTALQNKRTLIPQYGYQRALNLTQRRLCVLHFLYNGSESCRVVKSEIGKHLAVHFDTALVEKTHQLRIAEVVHTGSSVDTLDPESTEVAFFVFAVAISVGKTFFPGILSYGPYVAAAAKVASCKFEDFFAASARCDVVD